MGQRLPLMNCGVFFGMWSVPIQSTVIQVRNPAQWACNFVMYLDIILFKYRLFGWFISVVNHTQV